MIPSANHEATPATSVTRVMDAKAGINVTSALLTVISAISATAALVATPGISAINAAPAHRSPHPKGTPPLLERKSFQPQSLTLHRPR